MDKESAPASPVFSSWVDRLIWFCLDRKIIVFLMVLAAVGWGILTAPFDWDLGRLPRKPVPVDAIPDIGENQQIVFTEWEGRSPRDVEYQITYPLTAALLGLPGVKAVRGVSMFGFSSIYVIFHDEVDFYWSRSRVLEKLNSLPANSLPDQVKPALGPDATPLGQVLWYTLEGRDAKGDPAGGWDLQELRTIQDWYVRYALLSVEGVSEVASVGGFAQEYQVDVDPNLMRAYNVNIEEIVKTVADSNIDVGARTIEVNKVEYVIRGVGFIKRLEDLENSLIKLNGDVPVFLRNVANTTYGPAYRRGALDKGGSEAVGGTVVVRYGANPLAVIKDVKAKIKEISASLPSKTLPDGSVSRVTVVPFYDRSGLIYETLGTLNEAILQEILVAIIVIILMVMHLESAALISSALPLTVLVTFIAMKAFGVDANIVALSGIAIAIGTLDDMGIIITENILKRLDAAVDGESKLHAVYQASREVGGAVLTAGAVTVVSFMPVFFLEGAEGKLFRPLAFTKTFALMASVIVAVTVIPPLAQVFFSSKGEERRSKGWMAFEALIYIGVATAFLFSLWLGAALTVIGVYKLVLRRIPGKWVEWLRSGVCAGAAICVAGALTMSWLPFGPEKGFFLNFLFIAFLIVGLLTALMLFQRYYTGILGWCLAHKAAFLTLPTLILFFGGLVWIGFSPIYRFVPVWAADNRIVTFFAERFPGLAKEFMPPLDEGSFLYMPVTMPHASISEAMDIVRTQDAAIQAIPEVDTVVGKLGRSESALDPAPISMVETYISYKPEFISDSNGRPLNFRFTPHENDLARNETGEMFVAPDGKPYMVRGRFPRDRANKLIPDPGGKPFRSWRPPLDPELNPGRKEWKGIRKPDDIWDEITSSAAVPGVTLAPKLQPISARIVMLQSGIRAAMGVKIKGPNLGAIQEAGVVIEKHLREVPSIVPSSVIADRVIGKPYIEFEIDRRAIARYEISLRKVQEILEVAVGGKEIMTTVEDREKYPVRVRYMRELRDDVESLGRILVPSANGTQIPLAQLGQMKYVRGPEMIRTEDSFLLGYVLFDKKPGYAEVDVVEHARKYLSYKMEDGDLSLPPGTTFEFTGSYENQVRFERKLMLILPLVFLIIFVIIYLKFNSTLTTLLIFTCIPVAWAGGFVVIWLYGQPWFLDFSLLGIDMRELFQVHPINLSVAVWVGFLALFGIAADDGIVMGAYLDETFAARKVETVEEIRRATIEAGAKRIRPCLMTTATTILALLPVLTSSGKGSEVMLPMAVPSFGGMLFQVITTLIVPVLYCAKEEIGLRKRLEEMRPVPAAPLHETGGV